MKNRPRSISWRGFAVAFPIMLVIACSDQLLTTEAMPPTLQGPSFVEYSDHFYQGSDGYYYWDGQPPPGDLSPAEISRANAGGMAPRPGTHGWVEGQMDFIGDQAKLDLVYSVDSLGHPKYSNSQASSGWKWRDFGSRGVTQTHSFSQSLAVNAMCDFALEVGGTAYAHKALPFGISLNLIKFSVDVGFGTFTWGETSRPLLAFSDPGWSCDVPNSDCDRPETPEMEYCPVEGDPANSPGGQVGGGGGGEPTDVQGEYGGHSSPGGWAGGASYCVDWIDWWVSFDGGHSWQYDYRQCTAYEQM